MPTVISFNIYNVINSKLISTFQLNIYKIILFEFQIFPKYAQVFASYCSCYYYLQMMANVFNCSSTKMKTLPSLAPNFTDWVVLKNNNLRSVDNYFSYFDRIRYLDLGNNQIVSINDSFLSRLKNSKGLVLFNLAENQLRSIPEEFRELTKMEKIWLS